MKTIPISGNWLGQNNWVKDGLTWTKGEDVLKYDGCNWELNGKKVEYTHQLNNDQETIDYYNQLMDLP